LDKRTKNKSIFEVLSPEKLLHNLQLIAWIHKNANVIYKIIFVGNKIESEF